MNRPRLVSGTTFIKYANGQKIEIPNNLKVLNFIIIKQRYYM